MKCSCCGQVKHWSKFSARKNRSKGRSSSCKMCLNTQARAARRKNPGRHAAWHKRYRAKHPGAVMLSSAQRRAAKRGVVFSMTPEEKEKIKKRLARGVCELTGIPFSIGKGLRYDSPSLDRKDARKGYTYENVRVILFGLNVAMGSWGEDVLLQMLQKYLMKKRRGK